MTGLAEARADLQAWLPVAAALITQPDTQPSIGRTQPGSKPPWNPAVAYVLTDIHAGVREVEQDFRYAVTGTMVTRGGSDGNTAAAIDAICRLAEALDHTRTEQAKRLFDQFTTMICQLPAVDLEESPQKRKADCPFCEREMLRVYPRSGRVACLGCAARGHMVPGTLSDGYVLWEDMAP